MSGPQTRLRPAATGRRYRKSSSTARNPTIVDAIRVRIADHVNEHRLRQAFRDYLAAAKRGDRPAQVSAWTRYSTLHAKRSASCIARLEAKLGARLRRTLKRRLMTAFLHGALPRGCVAAAFRIFGLKEA